MPRPGSFPGRGVVIVCRYKEATEMYDYMTALQRRFCREVNYQEIEKKWTRSEKTWPQS